MTMPPRWRVAVVIPARDEASGIGATIASVQHALREASRVGRALSTTVVVIADSCLDRTALVAESVLGCNDAVLEVGFRNAGSARAAGCAHATSLLDGPDDLIWVANTDADSLVPADWILRQLDHADKGWVCVSGMVELVTDDLDLRTAFDGLYRRHVSAAWHPHVHGANFGVRADVLALVGNFADISTGEDHDLWERIGRQGLRRRADPSLVVRTSDRRVGRAPDGFAADLAALAGDV